MRKKELQSVQHLVSRVFDVEQKHLDPQTDLQRDLGADSLDKIQVAMELEEKFGIHINNADALQMDTVGDAARIVEQETASALSASTTPENRRESLASLS